MQGDKFLFYIRNREGYYYFVDELNTVQLSIPTVPRPLQHANKGWMEMVAAIIRNEKYRGNFKKITTPLQFVLDGKKILDNIAAYEGSQAYANFVIEQRVPDDFSYTLFFDGTIDFYDSYRFGEVYSTANIREQTLLDVLDAKENVVLEIPLTADNSVDIQIDGVNLHYKTLYTVTDGFGDTAQYYTGRHVVELVAASNENPNARETKRTKFPVGTVPPLLRNTGQPFYKAPVNGTLKIDYNYSAFVKWLNTGVVPGPASNFTYVIRNLHADNTDTAYIIYTANGQTNVFGVSYLSGKMHTVQGQINIPVIPGDEVYFYCAVNNMNLDGQACLVTYQDSPAEFILDTFQREPATLHKGIRPYKLFQELITKISDGRFGGVSPFLFNDNRKILIPGSALRKDDIISVKTTIAKFLKYCYVNHLAVITDAMGNNAEMKAVWETYLDSECMDLSEVNEFEWAYSKQHMIGSIKVGYENIDIGVDDQVNGKDEFNQTNYFTTGFDNIKEVYDIVSPYIASMYAIELLRINFANRKTTDNKNDNEVFIIDSEQGTDVKYYTGAFDLIATNTIRLPGNRPALPNGSSFVISGATSGNGTYTVVNTSYLVVGYTSITVAETVSSVSGLTGVLSYYDANVYHPYRPAYASVTGILDPATAYNIEISPKHLFLLHASIICSGVYNANSNNALGVIKFRSGDKNVLLSVSMDNIAFITENADEEIYKLPQPFYLPIEYSFVTDYRPDLFVYMAGINKYRHIGFWYKGNKLNGYVIDISSNPDNNEKQRWKLLSTVSTDLLNII